MRRNLRKLAFVLASGLILSSTPQLTTPTYASQYTVKEVVEQAIKIPTIALYEEGTPKEAIDVNLTIPAGQNEVIQPLTVSSKSTVFVDFTATGLERYVTLELFSDASCTKKVGYGTGISSSNLSAKLKAGVPAKGTYYLKASVTGTATNTIALTGKGYSYSASNRTLKNKTWTGTYPTSYQDITYYKITTPKNGYIKVEGKRDGGYGIYVDLCNSKKKSMLSNKSYLMSSNNYTTYYAVKKGTYYLKVSSVSDPYALRYTFTSTADQGGSSKAKATTIAKGKTKTGLVYVTDSKTKADWFKVKLTKKSKLKLKITSKHNETLSFEVIPASSRVTIINNTIRPEVGTSTFVSKDSFVAGTYYIKVTKNYDAKASGAYAIKFS